MLTTLIAAVSGIFAFRIAMSSEEDIRKKECEIIKEFIRIKRIIICRQGNLTDITEQEINQFRKRFLKQNPKLADEKCGELHAIHSIAKTRNKFIVLKNNQ